MWFTGGSEVANRPVPMCGAGKGSIQYTIAMQQAELAVEPSVERTYAALVGGAPRLDIDDKALRSPATPQAPALILD